MDQPCRNAIGTKTDNMCISADQRGIAVVAHSGQLKTRHVRIRPAQATLEKPVRRHRSITGRSRCLCLRVASEQASSKLGLKVVGLGLACWDFLGQVAAFPKPDEKIRTQRMEVCLKVLAPVLALHGLESHTTDENAQHVAY